jgi:hypothetical protein
MKTAVATFCVLLGSQTPMQLSAQPLFPERGAAPYYEDLAPVITRCWQEPRYFWSLKTGDLPYCRGHLKYTPGTSDCYTAEQEVCTVFLPATGEWRQTRQALPPTVTVCPKAPKPPLCPRNALLDR